ncbi:MAG TPA: hypothetical protein VMN58_13745 [Acidimicrobiales bacterium]|nr:hypothetical protein [Acidimicrobiales bacterium]
MTDDGDVTSAGDVGPEPMSTDQTGAPRWALLLLGGGAALVLGAFLPWVRILVFEISGVTARWGIVTLLGGIVVLVAAYQAWKGGLLSARATRPLLIAAAVAGGIGVLVPAAVAVELKESVAESEVSEDDSLEADGGFTSAEDDEFFDEEWEAQMEEFERSIAEAFAIKLGFGLWLSLLGGGVALAGAIDALRSRPERPPVP